MCAKIANYDARSEAKKIKSKDMWEVWWLGCCYTLRWSSCLLLTSVQKDKGRSFTELTSTYTKLEYLNALRCGHSNVRFSALRSVSCVDVHANVLASCTREWPAQATTVPLASSLCSWTRHFSSSPLFSDVRHSLTIRSSSRSCRLRCVVYRHTSSPRGCCCWASIFL